MWPRLILAFGALVIVLTIVGWALLSGFGCEMNTSGCSVVRLDMGRDALRIFLPPIAIGIILMVVGFRQMH